MNGDHDAIVSLEIVHSVFAAARRRLFSAEPVP